MLNGTQGDIIILRYKTQNRNRITMAYKNKKKNKAHQAEIRKINKHKKAERERKRNRGNIPVMTENDYLMLMRTRGLI